MNIEPIAYIENDLKEKFGIPRQSGRAPSLLSRIVFYPKFRNKDALRGIEGFSHLWLIFDFSLAHTTEFSPLVRPPRLGGNEKVGVFASRSPFRPNSLGLSSVKLVAVEETENLGTTLLVSGADLLNGTPIYDVKPYLAFSDSHPDAEGGFSDGKINYHLEIVFPDNLQKLIPQEKINALLECLSDDPRPSYQADGRVYGMKYSNFNVKFMVEEKVLTIVDVEVLPE